MAMSTDIEDFMEGPLVTWFYSCLDNTERLPDYEDLTDGLLLYEVLLQIDPEPVHHGVVPSLGNSLVRVRNMNIIVKNMKALYEEELCQVLLVLPDCVKLGQDPESKAGLENMQLLLLLLLGCAVQCPNKENFIERIKAMNVEVQHAIVDCIKQVTDNQQVVLTHDNSEVFSADVLLSHIRRLVKERDGYWQHWAGSITQERVDSAPSSEPPRKVSTQLSGGDTHHLAVELADWKARLRKQRQELEEKSEALAECKEELEHNKLLVTKLRQEVQELMQDARAAKAYRDELDAVRERAERVDKLESEVQRYREKLSDIEFYKTRVEELREDNRVLLETREMLEEQLQRARKRGEHVLDLEGDILKYKQHINELSLEREASQDKLQELFEENAQLQLLTRSVLNESAVPIDVESDNADLIEGGSGDNSLSEQLSSNAQARALKLELENRRLLSTIDSLKESSFHESSNKILELEKDKKKLSIKVDQLQENCQRLNQQNSELEQLFKDTLEDSRKLQDSVDALKLAADKHHQEHQANRTQIEELEKNVESINKEKQQAHTLAESLQRKVEEQERASEALSQQAENWKSEALKLPTIEESCSQARARIESLEKENQGVQKEVVRLRVAMEEKDVALDKNASEATILQKEMNRIAKELEEATSQIARLHEVERESQELMSRAAVDRETLATLQGNLVAHKLNNQQLKSSLERLGLDPEQLLDPDTVLDRIVSSAEVVNAIRELLAKEDNSEQNDCQPCEGGNCNTSNETACKEAKESEQYEELRQEVLTLQNAAEGLHSDNACLQVKVATLQSQISSLSTQHTALQLANSQLAAEKEEMVKERGLQQMAHEQLLLDQVTLQSLHEQLTTEYEGLLREREGLKATQRDLRSEVRTLKELCSRQETAQTALEQEKDKLKTESRSLGNLRAEHSSLKDDFRNLFTASEKLKQEYRSLQEEYRALRVDNGNMKLRVTELQGEMAKRNDHTTVLEVELSKMSNKCEMLLQMNTGLEDDRRSLMEHVSLLLSQYHELLTHSLEDKQHYHMEEKMFTDKVNNLCRQKEKLEEKIMEHYRKMDSCSTKKKSFGATLVRRVRKAGSDFISKVPRNRRSWHEDSRRIEDQSRHGLGFESGEGGNESDTSLDDLRARSLRDPRNSDGFTQSTLSLGSAGTRRTVYYTGEVNNESGEAPQETYVKDPEETAPFNSSVADTPSSSSPQKDSRTFLVYNRISTVIGGPDDGGVSSQGLREAPSQGSLSSHSQHSKLGPTEDNKRGTGKGKGKGENSIWYEYGCV